MSWTDVFKSKSSKLRADPRLRWFGKLPSYSDYYTSGVDESWAVEFNEWVLRGFQMYQARRRERAEKSDGRLRNTCGVVRVPSSGMTVFLSMFDFGGDMRGRPFPLCFYIGVPSKQCPGPTSDQLAGAAAVLRELNRLRDDVVRFLRAPGSFQATFRDRELPLDEFDGEPSDRPWAAEAKKLLLTDWFESVKGALGVDDCTTWIQAVDAAGARLASCDQETVEPTVCFPLSRRHALEPQWAGWLRWLEQRMELKRRFLTLLVTEDDASGIGRVSIIARDPLPEDFVLTTSLARSVAYADDFARLASGAAASGTGPRFQDISQVSWYDFVRGPVQPPTS
jgi:hypothetical protein